MRIALLGTRGIPARYSGFETCVEQLGSRLVQRGHDVTVYCRTHHVQYPEPVYKENVKDKSPEKKNGNGKNGSSKKAEKKKNDDPDREPSKEPSDSGADSPEGGSADLKRLGMEDLTDAEQ